MTGLRIADGPAGVIWIDDVPGEGVPVVFAHAFAGSSGHWSHQLAHLRPDRRAIAFDFRGHGHSSKPTDNDYSVQNLAADISAVADELNLQRMVLVGHSMGASAAIAYAGAEPERVAGLVLVGAPGRTPPEQAGKIVASIEANYDAVMQGYWDKLLAGARPEVRSRISAEIGSVPKDASLSIIKSLFAFDPLPALDRYHGPTLLVTTPHADGPDALDHVASYLPVKTFTGTSHWAHMDKPAEFNAMLDEFLATLQRQLSRPAITSRSA